MCEGCYAKTLPPEEREEWLKKWYEQYRNMSRSEYLEVEALFSKFGKKKRLNEEAYRI